MDNTCGYNVGRQSPDEEGLDSSQVGLDILLSPLHSSHPSSTHRSHDCPEWHAREPEHHRCQGSRVGDEHRMNITVVVGAFWLLCFLLPGLPTIFRHWTSCLTTINKSVLRSCVCNAEMLLVRFAFHQTICAKADWQQDMHDSQSYSCSSCCRCGGAP